jgi:hypothetical protein
LEQRDHPQAGHAGACTRRQCVCVCVFLDVTQTPCSHPLLQADPKLSRTVLVSTKFDTKLPQFGRGADVEMFIHPAAALGIGEQAEGPLGGAPYFT